MGNLEKPLTWGLVILLLGYLFVANCECGKDATCKLNNGFNIGFEDTTEEVKQEIKVEIKVEDENIDVDSIVDAVLEDIDMEDDADTVIEINIDLTEDEGETSYFESSDGLPKFPGGETALMQHIKENVNYPEAAKKNNIQGKVYTQYIVETDGSISNINIAKGVDELLNIEAMRVIATLPKYEAAGIIDGKKVKVKMTIPINFTL